MAISRFCSVDQEPYGFLAPRDWAACAIGVLRRIPEEVHYNWLIAIAVAGLSGFVTLRWPAARSSFRQSAGLAVGLLIAAAVQFAFMTSLDHVHRSDGGRYVLAAVFLWQGACLAFAVLQWSAVVPNTPRMRKLPYALLVLFAVTAAARHGRVGLDLVRQEIDEHHGMYSAEVLARGCTHVTGTYWSVWSTVFHANLVLADRGSPDNVWGIAQRCRPTADRWSQVPLAKTRIAIILCEEDLAAAYLQQYCVGPVTEIERGEKIRVVKPHVALAESVPAEWRR